MSFKEVDNNNTCTISYKTKLKYYNDINKYSKGNNCGLHGNSQLCTLRNTNERVGNSNCLIRFFSNCTLTTKNHKIPTNYEGNSFIEMCLCMNPKFKKNKKWITGCICYPQNDKSRSINKKALQKNPCNALFRKKCMHIKFGKYDNKKSSYKNVNCWIHKEKTTFENKYLNALQKFNKEIKSIERMKFNISKEMNTKNSLDSFNFNDAVYSPERLNSLDSDRQIRILQKDIELDKDYAQEMSENLHLSETDTTENVFQHKDLLKTMKNLKNFTAHVSETVPAVFGIIFIILPLCFILFLLIKRKNRNKRLCKERFMYRTFYNNNNNNNSNDNDNDNDNNHH